MFKDLTTIDPKADSVWNKQEYPALTRVDDSNDVFEIIQVSAADTNQQVQIWPTNVRTFPADRYAWYGTAPFCAGSCPDGTTQAAIGNYGDSKHECFSGHKFFCCENSVFEK